MASFNTSNMAQSQTKTSSAANTSSRARNTPPNINIPRPTNTWIAGGASSNVNHSSTIEAPPRSWPYYCRSPKIKLPYWAPTEAEYAEMSERGSNLSKNKKKTKRTANSSKSPSSIKFSPMTLFSQAADSLFGTNRSPVTDSPRKIEAEVDNLPNSITANAGIPVKKAKEKTKGLADPSKSNKAKDKCKKSKSVAWCKNSVLPDDEVITATIQNTTPACGRKKRFTCIVCNKEGFPLNEENRQQHVDGRAHQQIKGLLEAHRNGQTPQTDLLRIGPKKWKCHACDSAIQKPHVLTEAVRNHLEWHAEKIRCQWVKFKEMARSVAGLREDEIPHDVERSFI